MGAATTYKLDLNAAAMRAALAGISGTFSSFGSALGKIGALAGFTGGIGAAGAAVLGFKSAISQAADAESLQVAFATMIGDGKQAEETLKSLARFAADTPFEMPEVDAAARKLLAFGSSAANLEGELRSVGDVASGVQAPIGEIAEIYGKARVQGRLFAEDINQLVGRGIPVIQEFARQLGVSESAVKTRLSWAAVKLACSRTQSRTLPVRL